MKFIGPDIKYSRDAIVREIVVEGNGDFDKLRARINATKTAWVGDLVNQKAVVAYPVQSETEELLASVIAAAIGSGYMITKTRLRALERLEALIQIRKCLSEPNDGWYDFALFTGERNFLHLFRSAFGEPLQAIALKPTDEPTAGESGSVVAGNGSAVQARAGSTVCAQAGSIVYAWRDSQVVAQCASTVFAYTGANVCAGSGAEVHAEVGSLVTARSGSTVYADGGSSVIAYCGSTIHAGSGAKIIAYPGSTVIAHMGSEVSYIP